MDEVRAGTAYGASTYAGPTGARQPSELELDYAQHQVGGAGQKPGLLHGCLQVPGSLVPEDM